MGVSAPRLKKESGRRGVGVDGEDGRITHRKQVIEKHQQKKECRYLHPVQL